MTDKELIRQEIERRIVQAEEFAERAKGANDDSSKLSWDFVATQNQSLLQFIDSLSEEPTVKGITWKDVNILDTLINQVRYEFPNGIGEKSFGLAVLEKFQDYQDDIEEPASEDLDFLVISLEETIGTSPHSREVIKEHLQKAAEWGRNHIEDKSEMVSEDLEEEIEFFWNSHDGSMNKFEYQRIVDCANHFAEWQKQQMIKDAVECSVEDWNGDSPEITIPLNPQYFKTGDKVKIVIVKEEQ